MILLEVESELLLHDCRWVPIGVSIFEEVFRCQIHARVHDGIDVDRPRTELVVVLVDQIVGDRDGRASGTAPRQKDVGGIGKIAEYPVQSADHVVRANEVNCFVSNRLAGGVANVHILCTEMQMRYM